MRLPIEEQPYFDACLDPSKGREASLDPRQEADRTMVWRALIENYGHLS